MGQKVLFVEQKYTWSASWEVARRGKVEKSLWLADHIVRVFTPHLIVIGQCTMHTVHLAQCSHVHVYHALLCNVHIAPGCCFCIVQLVGCVCCNLTFSSTLFRLLTFKHFLPWLKNWSKKTHNWFCHRQIVGILGHIQDEVLFQNIPTLSQSE